MSGGLRAFLVDDEPLARTRLARLLGATGRVEIVGQAGDAAEALTALARVSADVVFLHRIAPGSAERSYGIHVAQLAGVPPAVLRRAEAVLTELESRHHLPAAAGEVPPIPTSIIERRRKRTKQAGPDLFQEPEALT